MSNPSALGSVLGTIATTANTVSSLLNTTTKSIGMLDAFVTKAADEQRKSHIRDAREYDLNLAHDHAEAMSALEDKAEAYCNKSEAHAARYTSHYDTLMSLITPKSQAKEA